MIKIRKTLFVIYKIVFIKTLKFLIIVGDISISFPRGILSSLAPKKKVSPITDDLLLTPATVLAKKVREKEITSEKLVTTFINRIKEVNPILNAVVEDRFSRAIEEARRVDVILANNTYSLEELKVKYPLLGIPITIKESIAVAGMSHKVGMVCSREKADADADVVRKIKESGAIITAVTNTPELCLDWECYNNVTGKTSNPYDNRRTCGGSSGGEAALISSAASIFGIGSDALGSLRLPAHFCGIFSHKPTNGTVPIEGHIPMAEEKQLWEQVFTLGPMTRYSLDLALLLRVICKEEKKEVFDFNKNVDYSKLTIFYMKSFEHELTHSVIGEIKVAIDKTLDHFRTKYNTQTQKWRYQDLVRSADRSQASLISIKGFDDIFEKDPKRSCVLELIKFFLGLSNHTFFAICHLILHRSLPFYNLQKTREKIQVVKKNMSKILGNNGVLICPTFPMDAPYHRQLFTKSYNNVYMSTFNSLGLPVTVCPVGFSKQGLPIGLQIVGKEDSDFLTIAVAQEMEKIFGGWRAP